MGNTDTDDQTATTPHDVKAKRCGGSHGLYAYNMHSMLVGLTITDATGRETTFSYELGGQPLLVTRITDPFGRFAHIDYDGAGRLVRITDAIGLVPEVGYDAGSLAASLTTPYGTTHFAYAEVGRTPSVKATDPLGLTERPLGLTERVEFRHQAPGYERERSGSLALAHSWTRTAVASCRGADGSPSPRAIDRIATRRGGRARSWGREPRSTRAPRPAIYVGGARG